jgi:hypothetical protein
MKSQRKFVRFIVIGAATDYYYIIMRELADRFFADCFTSLVEDPGLTIL